MAGFWMQQVGSRLAARLVLRGGLARGGAARGLRQLAARGLDAAVDYRATWASGNVA